MKKVIKIDLAEDIKDFLALFDEEIEISKELKTKIENFDDNAMLKLELEMENIKIVSAVEVTKELLKKELVLGG